MQVKNVCLTKTIQFISVHFLRICYCELLQYFGRFLSFLGICKYIR